MFRKDWKLLLFKELTIKKRKSHWLQENILSLYDWKGSYLDHVNNLYNSTLRGKKA